MSAKPLIVPIVLTTGSLRFAEVQEDAVAQDVINSLVAETEEVRTEVNGGLDDHGWALQKIRAEHNGRPWEEEQVLTVAAALEKECNAWRVPPIS